MENMRPPIVPDEPVPVLARAELGRVLKVCKGTTFEDGRDLAVICLLADSGIRRAELAGLHLDDVDFDRKTVTVLGKGRRPRLVPFGAKTAQALDRWLGTGRATDSPTSPTSGSERRAGGSPTKQSGRCSNGAASRPESPTCTLTGSATRSPISISPTAATRAT